MAKHTKPLRKLLSALILILFLRNTDEPVQYARDDRRGKNLNHISRRGLHELKVPLAFLVHKDADSKELHDNRRRKSQRSWMMSQIRKICLLYTSPSPRDRG